MIMSFVLEKVTRWWWCTHCLKICLKKSHFNRFCPSLHKWSPSMNVFSIQINSFAVSLIDQWFDNFFVSINANFHKIGVHSILSLALVSILQRKYESSSIETFWLVFQHCVADALIEFGRTSRRMSIKNEQLAGCKVSLIWSWIVEDILWIWSLMAIGKMLLVMIIMLSSFCLDTFMSNYLPFHARDP